MSAADVIERLRSAAARCTRVNADVALLCEHALTAATEIERQSGECNTLVGILRDAQAVIETIVPENDDESERLFALRVAMAHAVDPYQRVGALL